MKRARSRHDHVAIGARARFVLVGAVSALLLVGVLSPPDAGASTASGQQRDSSSYVVQHDATVSVNASSPARSHRLLALGAYLVATCFAAIAAQRMASRGRRTARRRIEQFHVRLRGPPLLLVAH